MFTGIVEEVGKINSIVKEEISIKCEKILENSKIGDSISVSGICLTITKINQDNLSFQISEETKSKTILGKKQSINYVNLERAATFESRIGGHLIEGHVESTAMCKEINQLKDSTNVIFEANPDVISNIIVKGYISIDGTSLTINKINKNLFSISLIPHTLKETTFKDLKVKQFVNIETDVNARYIKKYVEQIIKRKQNE